MSSIDPGISLAVKTPQPADPIESYSKIVSLKNMMNQGRIQEQALGMGKLQQEHEALLNKEDERKVAANQAMAQAIQQNSRVDDDGSFNIDHDKVEAAVTRAGYPDQALLYSKSRKEIEDNSYNAVVHHLDIKARANEQFGKMAQTILNADPSIRPQVYAFTLKNAVSSGLVDQKTLADRGISAQYQGPQTDQLLQSISDYAAKDPAKELRDRMTAAREQREFEIKSPGEIADSQKKQVELESQLLGGARSQADWDNALAKLPPGRRDKYPAEFSDEARQQAAASGVSPDTRATLARYTSKTELAYAAQRGDADAKKALKTLEDSEIHVETAKKYAEMNAMLGIGGPTAMPGQAPGAGTSPAPGQPIPLGGGGLNEQFLSKLDPGLAAEVRSLVAGKIPFPSGVGNYRLQPLIRLAEQYDPSFDATNYGQRAKLRADFTTGKAAQTNNALNTVVQHLERLDKSIDGLGNFENIPVLNKTANAVKNWLKEQSGNTESINKFRDDVEAVSSEAVRVWRQAGGSEKDIQDWKKNLSISDSPSGLKSSLMEIGDLLEGKIVAQQNQFDQGMGKLSDIKVMSPESERVLNKLRGIKSTAKYGDPRITEDIMARARAANPGVDDKTLADAIAKSGKLK